MPDRQPAPALPIALAGAAVLLTACVPSENKFAGTMIDARSGAPIPNGKIVVWSRGWGFSDGSLVWDKQYLSRATADRAGRFSLAHVGATSPAFCARADGYETTLIRSAAPARNMRVPLTPRLPRPAGMKSDLLFVGFTNDGRTLGWSFEAGETADADSADLWLQSEPDLHAQMTFVAPGGLVPAAQPAHPVAPSNGEAPESGYAERLNVTLASGRTIFVRTRDERHYARIELSAGYSLMTYPSGRKGLQLRYVYDPSGGRSLRSDSLEPYCPD